MSYVIGIDGGGTKTSFLLLSAQNGTVRQIEKESICPRDHGINLFKTVIEETMRQLTDNRLDEVASLCVGIPCYGEDPELDRLTAEILYELFPNNKKTCVNDCVVGYAGALGLKPGVNIVSGTGAIAYGENSQGKSARSNGWSGEFADEGSCSWLGRKCIELFCKQSDGRLPKMALYDLVKSELGLNCDFDFIKVYDARFKGNRQETAKLQMLLYSAAECGDESAKSAYRHAAYELAISVEAVRKAAEIGEQAPVSYSGGLFKTGDLILRPFEEALNSLSSGYRLQEPEFSPVEGALLMAAREIGGDTEAKAQKIIRDG